LVEIKEFEEGKLGLFASRQIDSGYIILVLDGNYFPEPTRTSIQIGDRHMEHYEGGFMNHHCDPSAKIVRLHAHGIIEPLVLASRKINQGEQVTFDYETTGMIEIIEQDIFNDLFERYPQLEDTYRMLFVSGGRIQETEPQGGYHSWHHEQSWDISSRNTVLAWSLFLNDVKEGGELEFLYQSLRIRPVRNHFLIWPAGFTHLHRGNPPLKDPKLIFTGWIDFA
jgi:hypothetical protein